MKIWYNKISKHKLFFTFVFLFAYAQSIRNRVWVINEINWYVFTPDAAIASFIACAYLIFIILFFIKRSKQKNKLTAKNIFTVFAKAIIVYLLSAKFLEFIIALIFNNVARNFNTETFLLSLFTDLLNVLIYGSFFLAYYFFSENKTQQEKLVDYNQALAVSKINQLKAQLNPHFLFNNLNVLDQLIEEDKDTASNFLNEFADIYRYVIDVSEKNVVSIQEELSFAKKYFSLIKHKYGDAYQLQLDIENDMGNIVPLTLQLLVENAIKHNIGTKSCPVIIKIIINSSIFVTNNIIPKTNAKTASEKGLKNLKAQYELLSNTKIEILQQNESFGVTIPII